MLIEKYRPKSLDEIVGQKRVVTILKQFVKKREMPNILLVGRAGTGKTACAYALRYELGCHDISSFRELNASDERGIKVVREIIKNFARQKAYVNVPFKICLLDQADGLTKQAQDALLRVMEQYHKSVRFILTVNVLGRLSQMMVSRCSIFHMRGLHPANMMKLLKKVSSAEKQWISDFVLKAIAEVAHGDARMALNTLEAMFGLEKPTAEDVYAVVGETDPTHVYQLIHRAVKGRVDDTLSAMRLLIRRDGASATALLQQMYYATLSGKIPGLTENQRLRILIHLGDLPYVTDDIKLTAILSKILSDEKLRS